MDYNTLIGLQDVEFIMIKDLDAYCRKWNIRYSLYAGTMLGAVRHGGFIPWNDDVCIAMTQREYSRFCKVITEYLMEGNYLAKYKYPICLKRATNYRETEHLL